MWFDIPLFPPDLPWFLEWAAARPAKNNVSFAAICLNLSKRNRRSPPCFPFRLFRSARLRGRGRVRPHEMRGASILSCRLSAKCRRIGETSSPWIHTQPRSLFLNSHSHIRQISAASQPASFKVWDALISHSEQKPGRGAGFISTLLCVRREASK